MSTTPEPDESKIDFGFTIPKEFEKQFDDNIMTYNYKLMTMYSLLATRIQQKAMDLNLNVIGNENYKSGCGNVDGEGALNVSDPVMASDWAQYEKFCSFLQRQGTFSLLKRTRSLLTTYYTSHERGQLLEATDNSQFLSREDKINYDQLYTKIGLEKSLSNLMENGGVVKSSPSRLPPSYFVLTNDMATSYCKRFILDCMRNNMALKGVYYGLNTEQMLERASIGDYHSCLQSTPCFSKVAVWFNLKEMEFNRK